MARITVEDCIDKFASRFELVLIASNRARKLHSGENPTVDKDNDKNTVIALREIAEETLTINDLKNSLIEEYQTTSFIEDESTEEIESNDDKDKDITNDNNNNNNEDLLYSDKDDQIENLSVEDNQESLEQTSNESKVEE